MGKKDITPFLGIIQASEIVSVIGISQVRYVGYPRNIADGYLALETIQAKGEEAISKPKDIVIALNHIESIAALKEWPIVEEAQEVKE